MPDLFTNTVQPATLRLLHELMEVPALSEFLLVGGTNLSLRYGHRVSVDLDLFTNRPFDREEVYTGIIKVLPQTVLIDQRKQTMWLTIKGIKVDIILHEYPYLKGEEELNGIRFLAIEDIIPMKLEAMATRGVKKDFWDITELLNYFSLQQMLKFHEQRYPNSDPGHILLAMTYFIDADVQKVDPISLNDMTWERVKDIMRATVNQYVRGGLQP